MVVRDVKLSDAERIRTIYSYYVESTAVSFEYDVPSIEEFENRISKTIENFPYYVVEDEGVVIGYAYAGPFVGRIAYRFSAELSIYIGKDSKGKGCGRMLYDALEKELSKRGFTNLYACIGDPIEEDEYLTRDSEHFHEHMGFKKVGTFYKCGYKFGRWYNMIWVEKIIKEHEKN